MLNDGQLSAATMTGVQTIMGQVAEIARTLEAVKTDTTTIISDTTTIKNSTAAIQATTAETNTKVSDFIGQERRELQSARKVAEQYSKTAKKQLKKAMMKNEGLEEQVVMLAQLAEKWRQIAVGDSPEQKPPQTGEDETLPGLSDELF